MPRFNPARIWRHLTKEQCLSIIITLISAFQAIFFAVEYGASISTYISIAIGTTIIIVSDRIGRYYFENTAIRKLTFMQYKDDSLECIGALKQGVDWFIDNLDGAQTVRNTVFSRSARNLPSLDRNRLAEFTSAVKMALNSNCLWQDVYTTNETDTIEAFEAALSKEQKEFYITIPLDTDMPMLQYAVIHYRNNSSAVIFGWSFVGGRND